ncbi:MAG: aspartate--ammonia ligase [Ruminococcaceae bacterium]|nr:aspartate--ammonia ligase [Oscillospiraceae bacterium]
MNIIPTGYKPLLSLIETEHAIKAIKDHFERSLADALNLTRVSAPLFVRSESGLNDNLNGVERPVSFDVRALDGKTVEVVHSLAKWKRQSLARYGFAPGEGLYTDMNAIRRDEDTDNIHSIYVDQWDWESIITPEERTMATFEAVVRKIFASLKATETYIREKYPVLPQNLPEEIVFFTSQELLDRYPDKTAKEREYAAAKEHGAICITGIGGALSDGKPHDGRAPDYDDWDMNGDILIYYPVLDIALEISSMGIRVNEQSLTRQLEIAGCRDRAALPFHKALLNGELPLTIGGGIGQSRICMLMLGKAHIGEVHASAWNEKDVETFAQAGVTLL